VRDVMTTDCEHVDAALSVQEFVNWRLARGEGRCFLVYDAERLAGMTTLADVRKIERERWPQTTMRQIMQPIESVPAVPSDTPVQEAMEKMMREDREVLIVAEQGTMVGIVSRAHILRLLQVRSELRAA
jgi:CBS domain-containing protein